MSVLTYRAQESRRFCEGGDRCERSFRGLGGFFDSFSTAHVLTTCDVVSLLIKINIRLLTLSCLCTYDYKPTFHCQASPDSKHLARSLWP